MADPTPLYLALLRPPVLMILRAAGFTATRPSVLDTLVDLTSRHLILLAQRTAEHANSHPNATPLPHPRLPLLLASSDAANGTESETGHSTHPPQDELEDVCVTLADARLAMQELGLLVPQLSAREEAILEKEDMRGVQGFIDWCYGDANKEVRRIAGMTASAAPRLTSGLSPSKPSLTANVAALGGLDGASGPPADPNSHNQDSANGTQAVKPPAGTASNDALAALNLNHANEDYLTQLKKKHFSKAGEESRYQGTSLGKDLDTRAIRIEGWNVIADEDEYSKRDGSNGAGDVGPIDSIAAWEQRVRGRLYGTYLTQDEADVKDEAIDEDEAMSSSVGSPLTDLSGSSPG